MLYNWAVLFQELVDIERRRRFDPLADPFADPLERPEWRGLDWTSSDGRRKASPVVLRRFRSWLG